MKVYRSEHITTLFAVSLEKGYCWLDFYMHPDIRDPDIYLGKTAAGSSVYYRSVPLVNTIFIPSNELSLLVVHGITLSDLRGYLPPATPSILEYSPKKL